MKILLVSTSTGLGHYRAAEALKESAHKWHPELEVEHIDFAEFVTLPMKAAVLSTYDILVKQAPELWGFFYNKTNSPAIQKLKIITKTINKLNSSKFFRYIEQYQPDYIVFTHFLPAEIYHTAELGNLEIPSGTLITDYGTHELWITGKKHDYFVATEKMMWELFNKDIPNNQITVSGIPVDPVFYEKFDKNDLKKQLNLNSNKTILCVSGGNGLTDITRVVEVMFKSEEELNIVAVAGTNSDLKEKLLDLKPPKNIKLQIFGWIDNIHLYMKAADAVVGKVGGMTTTECAAIGTPIIGIDPIPGQEEQNADYILENKLGCIAKSPDELMFYLSNIPEIKKLKPDKTAGQIILDKIKSRF